MTLRRAMMSRAPSKGATSRLIYNVDASWNQPSKHIITTLVGRNVEAQRFLANMIPELLHCFGDEASKWFTKDVKWNPGKGTTALAKKRDLLLYWSNPVSQVLRAMAFKRTTRGRSNFGELVTAKIS
jgi:hypothetical protein